jgi:hypothetical protein
VALDQAGGADEDRDAGANRPVKARAKSGRGGEVDQHVAPVGIERECGIALDGGGDRLAHPPFRGEQGDADRFGGVAHGALLAQRGGPRN